MLRNRLFVCMASVLIEALFPDRVSPDLRARYREAMHIAMKGNSRRHGLWHGDDLYPSYTNVSQRWAGRLKAQPFLLRCVCTTIIANLVGDADLAEQAEVSNTGMHRGEYRRTDGRRAGQKRP